MSKEDVPPKTPKVIDFDKLQKITDFINKRTTAENDNCLVCGSPDNGVSGYQVHIVVDDEKKTLFNAGVYMPAYVTICNNCGFIRTFAAISVDKHIDEES